MTVVMMTAEINTDTFLIFSPDLKWLSWSPCSDSMSTFSLLFTQKRLLNINKTLDVKIKCHSVMTDSLRGASNEKKIFSFNDWYKKFPSINTWTSISKTNGHISINLLWMFMFTEGPLKRTMCWLFCWLTSSVCSIRNWCCDVVMNIAASRIYCIGLSTFSLDLI